MKKLISTDSVGFLGSPEQFLYLYREYFQDATFDGVEMIAFKPLGRLKNFVAVLEKSGIATVSFHGKTAGENRLPAHYGVVMTIVNSLIFDAWKLAKSFPEVEFLSHTPYLEKNQIKNFLTKRPPKIFWVENHAYGKQGIDNAIKLIEWYWKRGLNAQGMLDVYHLLAKIPPGDLQKKWSTILDEISGYLKWFRGIHFPIGTRKNDSLDIENMSDEMLALFGKKIVSRLDRVVIENQQKNLGLFFSANSAINKIKRRNRINFTRLKKAGIL
ncbi:hypothetical protein M1328_01195 [Patescibacteria group bacterium]|nr:hypothetical protein [Patescibacteria group bacterium]